ncbi:GNAT family N-acetyltransferase [Actinoplanes sp. NPDC020271]|uniref:GNAT family N-acetyltransferase n=1 Tax=Actinoplanes sp. NPDC020271 TaxID=3363896 RepID=UPI003787889D
MTDSETAVRIRRAQQDDTGLVASILADAFFHGDLAGWLVPDETLRAAIYPPYFRLLAGHAIEYGHVEVLGSDATAVWFDLDHNPAPVLDDYDAQLAAITGSTVSRFRQLDHAMHEHHPDPRREEHAYLAFLAVRPARQSHGLGAALLTHRLTDLSRQHRAAYLEATGSRNRGLYQRFGFEPLDPYTIVPGGPQLYPMWRSRHTEI